MYIKEKVGSIELIKPDKDLVKLINEIIEQNQTILELNKVLINRLSSPLEFIFKSDCEEE